jgi:glycolate oxidase iron-sulfur subunit
MDSPRGRIQLMGAAADGRIGLDGAFTEHLELCLGCRACETACPSGVQYGLLFESARAAIVEKQPPGPFEQFVRWLSLRQLLPHQRRMRALAFLARLYQISGLSTLVRRLKFLPPNLRAMEELLPPLSLRFPDYGKPAPAIGEKRGAVGFLVGCVQDAFLTEVNAATVRVLQRNGYEVHFPQGQTCCGAAPLHIGEGELARDLARRNVAAFDSNNFVAILNNAGGCGATLREYTHLLADETVYGEKARHFVAKVKDINEFLAGHLHTPPTGRLDVRVAYVDSCHLRHGQKIVRQPRQLLRAIPGVTLVELNQPDMCCGSAGIYNIMQPELAARVLDAKVADVASVQPDIVVATNTGCHMQLLHGMQQSGLKMQVLHLVELLDRSYRIAGK